MPVFLLEGKTSAELDGVNGEAIEHVPIDDCDFLDRFMHADGTSGEAKVIPQLRIGNCGYAGGKVAGEIHRHTVRLTVVQRGEHTFSGGHDGFSDVMGK